VNFSTRNPARSPLRLISTPAVATPQAPQHLAALTGLRFFAAAAIVIHHLNGYPGLPADFDPRALLGQGVCVFFVLSGFILTHVYPDLPTWRDKAGFYWARWARIWPVHIFMLCVVIALDGFNPTPGHNPSASLGPLMANVTLTQAWVPMPAYFFSFNSVSWSISCELGFYALFPLLIAHFKTDWAWKFIAAFAVALTIVQAATHFGVAGLTPYSTGLTWEGLSYVNPLVRLCEFIAGMIAALTWQRFQTSSVPRPTFNIYAWTLLEVAAVVLLVSNIALVTKFIFPLIGSYGEAAAHWMTMSFTPMLPAAILIGVLANGKGLVAMMLGSRLLRFLGEISFAIYMTHRVILDLVLKNFADWGIWSLPMYLGLVLAISALVWAVVERPMRRWFVQLPGLVQGIALNVRTLALLWRSIASGPRDIAVKNKRYTEFRIEQRAIVRPRIQTPH
jgi:peptidoglycan/LPS O-acetylase OafA/YrhL